VHAGGARIFAELSHAGSQTMMPGLTPPAPSGISSAIYPGVPRELPAAEIEDIVGDFGAAARRAAEAGFDGIHLHGGNGYLISQFGSPLTNRRDDAWGGDAERRGRFFMAVLDAVRGAVGPDLPVTARFGISDSIPGGMREEEGLARAAALAARGLDGFEPSLNLMASYRDNIQPYVGLGMARALADWVAPRLWSGAAPQGYYRPLARALRRIAPDKAIILVGGLRSTEAMAEVLDAGEADFLSFARPFVREPDFPNQLAAGRRGMLDCVSCNICLQHDGYDALRCWRRDKRDLMRHALWRLRRAP
jgi:2,4-dienoyl-CoA reductase-like NADH-dependent reductase (Old Yellow Enzyme family)